MIKFNNFFLTRNYFSLLILVLFASTTFIISTNNAKWKKNQIFHWDVCGYHNYLPAIFIYHDLDLFVYFDSIDTVYHPSEVKRYALYEIPKTGKICNQYPIGVALFQTPFFLIAHEFCKQTSMYPADGYSSPYQHATFLSTWFFVMLSLFVLRKFLLFYFNDKIVAITLLIICLGTNLYAYVVVEPGLSHPYLFFLYSSILYLTHMWYKKATWVNSILIGICLGLCAITRPVDVLVFLIPLLWTNNELIQSKIKYLLSNKFKLLLIVLFGLIAIFPQLYYWKMISGDWIYYSYSKTDYFVFDRPRILRGLFSYRKGWFLYSPLLMLGFIGAYKMYKLKDYKFYFLPFWVFFLPMIYIVFSWRMWTYGWSFGCRALLDTVPLIALPIAVVLNILFTSEIIIKVLSSLIISFLLFLSVFQNWQYSEFILQGDNMGRRYYWSIFLKTSTDDNDMKLLQEQKQIDYLEDY